MKKLLITTAIIGFLLTVSNTGNAGNKVRKLPSKIRITNQDVMFAKDGTDLLIIDGTYVFHYDELNRIVEIENIVFGDPIKITYDANHNPIKMDVDGEERIFQYNNNQISVSRTILQQRPHKPDILTINANGQLVKLVHLDYSALIAAGVIVEETIEFTYTDKNTIMSVSTKFEDEDYDSVYKSTYTPSHVKSIWQYVNVPDWLLTYIWANFQAEVWMEKNINMPLQFEQRYYVFEPYDFEKYTYELDTEGYTKQINTESRPHETENVWYYLTTIEYITAK